MVDYQKRLYNPKYRLLGVPATISGVLTDDIELTVIDKTAGIEVGLGDVAISTIKPAAKVRAVELASKGVSAADIDDASITFNGNTWLIKGFMPRPSPNGEADGEYLLFLIADEPDVT